jgi:sugar transferase EpsL
MSKRSQQHLKRGLDFSLSLLGLILFSFPLVIIAIVIQLIEGGPVLFKHPRPGKNSQIFHLYKFRTMKNRKGLNGKLLQDDARLTKLGSFLRKFSLDEIPELWNVLKGDMSLVGPRPLVVQYLDRYTLEQARRHEVYPGVTGLAQIKGRNELMWQKRFEYDIWYVDHWNLCLDMKIILQTIFNVITARGISHPGYATMKEFWGNHAESEMRSKEKKRC